MSVNSWTPAEPNQSVDETLLKKGINAAMQDALESLPEQLSPEEQSALAVQVRLTQASWSETLQQFSSDELRAALRFFVKAEMLIPGCEAGDQSPAIWANRLLKQRGERLNQDELRWIRENTNNRFIPNGAL
ncbi:hypothetical protein FHR99_001289 [Litorivivens lipolytica]|uniref:Uncharacterized protein n=1 Tax=Litorivivens lipolytica TaxID=1524264 RepID=A0A7W4W4K6_9GAMM|nr:hypothetical protein [Litorivivens lipolytica]MBB3047053.1 hypothetical protein [Litorivivens lipolytica]